MNKENEINCVERDSHKCLIFYSFHSFLVQKTNFCLFNRRFYKRYSEYPFQMNAFYMFFSNSVTTVSILYWYHSRILGIRRKRKCVLNWTDTQILHCFYRSVGRMVSVNWSIISTLSYESNQLIQLCLCTNFGRLCISRESET